MISRILFIVVMIYFVTRLYNLFRLIWQQLSRAGSSGPQKPTGGDSGGEATARNELVENTSSAPGRYVITHDLHRGSQRAELMITAAPEVLPEIFFDLVEKMGEQIILMVGEVLPGEQARQMISFSPLLKVSQLQTQLAEFADILNRLATIEMKIQNIDKCCHLILSTDKLMLLEVCNVAPYVAALQRRKFREVQADEFEVDLMHAQPPQKAKAVPEERLAQFKQRLEISASCFPAPSWLN